MPESRKGWLVIAAGEQREHGGNEGYDDDPALYYSWDDTVPNHNLPRVGDTIALWNKVILLGVSLIDRIERQEAQKLRRRCPACGSTNLKQRKVKAPQWRCADRSCRKETDDPEEEMIGVHAYRALHGSTWTSLPGVLSAEDLRVLTLQPKSQHSIRELDFDHFYRALETSATLGPRDLWLLKGRNRGLVGGHSKRLVRVRRGQGAFRARIREKYLDTCAFTGKQPGDALDAAHLYSFAAEGQHHEHGGVLLRKDVHRLFDKGLLCVDLETGTIDVHESLYEYPEYSKLHGRSLLVDIPTPAKKWLKMHWELHRSAGA